MAEIQIKHELGRKKIVPDNQYLEMKQNPGVVICPYAENVKANLEKYFEEEKSEVNI